jgi:hypothetical protein
MYRGATFPVGATIQNNGPGDAGPFKVRFLLETGANTPALVLGDASIPGLKAGTEQDVLQSVTLPYSTPSDFAADSPTARIVAQIDPDRSVDQTNTTNDTLAAPYVQLKVLTPDGQTTVPTLSTGTASASSNGKTTTTSPAPAGSTSNFTTSTVTASTGTPATTSPASTSTPTTTSTPTSANTKSGAMVHTQVIARRAQLQAQRAQALRAARLKARNHALKVYRPAAKHA